MYQVSFQNIELNFFHDTKFETRFSFDQQPLPTIEKKYIEFLYHPDSEIDTQRLLKVTCIDGSPNVLAFAVFSIKDFLHSRTKHFAHLCDPIDRTLTVGNIQFYCNMIPVER